MSSAIQQYIKLKLQQRLEENNLRSLKIVGGLVDFYSNDYLGFARDPILQQTVLAEIKQHGKYGLGSTGSRLLSGNSEYITTLENFIARFHQAESALIFNSGFDANYGLLSTLPYRGDTIIYDELVHASMHDGIRSSRAKHTAFAHNNLVDLQQKLISAAGNKYVVVESMYSMDGDFAPLTEIAAICKKHDAGLIVDEAHATGIYGNNGAGRVNELGLETDCLVRVHTFGKALGTFGAVVLCSDDLKQFLINYCRPFIFSTALPFSTLAQIKCAYEMLPLVNDRRQGLLSLVEKFKMALVPGPNLTVLRGTGPVQSVIIEGHTQVKRLAQQIQSQGFDVRPILTPTVPRGSERIRICLHSFNTEQEVLKLAQLISQL